MRLENPPTWRAATADEVADYLNGEVSYNIAGEPYEMRETPDGLEVLEGTPAECGCILHSTYTRGMWGFYCETEDNAYCNHECPHWDYDNEG